MQNFLGCAVDVLVVISNDAGNHDSREAQAEQYPIKLLSKRQAFPGDLVMVPFISQTTWCIMLHVMFVWRFVSLLEYRAIWSDVCCALLLAVIRVPAADSHQQQPGCNDGRDVEPRPRRAGPLPTA